MAITRVNIQELKNRFNHYIRLTKAGQTVEITENGIAIGRIIPSKLSINERLEAMEKLGLLTRARKKLPTRKPVSRSKGDKTMSEILIEDRE